MMNYINIIIAVFSLIIIISHPITCKNEVLFNGERYLQYRPSKSIYEQDNINRIDIQFRTIHPSGVLVIMMGRYESTLVVQLVQGKLRYSIAHRSQDVSQIIIGTNLNDNSWHRVTVLRTGRLNEITVDKTSKTLLAPVLFESLSVSEVFFIGGYNHFELLNIKNTVSLGSKFVGCLQVTQIDNRDPISSYLKGNGRVKAFPSGLVTFGCEDNVRGTFGFTKPKSKLIVNFNNNLNKTGMHLTMSVRTLSKHGGIFVTKKSKCFVRVGLLNGKVYMEFVQDIKTTVLAKVEARAVINDGQWHKLSFAVTDTDMFLRVDENQRYSRTLYQPSGICMQTQQIMFGGISTYNQQAFIGCMNNIIFNEYTLKHEKEKSNQIHHVIRGYALHKISVNTMCQLTDKCYPNPCRNSGRCSQTWKGFQCDCSRINFYGQKCEKSIYKSTCAAYQQMGLAESSFCLIDSDTNGDLPPYTALCQFDTKRQEVYTAVHHNKEKEFSAVYGDETFQLYTFHHLKYEMSSYNIETLIARSKYCRQSVKFKCYNTAILNAPTGPSNVGWRSRTGELQNYWGIGNTSKVGCACGVNKTCIKPDKLCNCDAGYMNRWLEDAGYITSKKDLPITRLDVAGIVEGSGIFKIGPLECFGLSDGGEGLIHDTEIPGNFLERVCMTNTKKDALVKIANDTNKLIIDPKLTLITTKEAQTNFNFRNSTTDSPTVKNPSHNVGLSTNARNKAHSSDLSVLEIILISVAGVAVLILVIKFIICNVVGRLYGQVVLNPEVAKARCDSNISASHTLTSTLPPGTDGGYQKKKRKKNLSSYWV